MTPDSWSFVLELCLAKPSVYVESLTSSTAANKTRPELPVTFMVPEDWSYKSTNRGDSNITNYSSSFSTKTSTRSPGEINVSFVVYFGSMSVTFRLAFSSFLTWNKSSVVTWCRNEWYIGLLYPFTISKEDRTSKPYIYFDVQTADTVNKLISASGNCSLRRIKLACITPC